MASAEQLRIAHNVEGNVMGVNETTPSLSRMEGVGPSTLPADFFPLRQSPLLPMSSTESSSSKFRSILDAALSDYAKRTGIDLATHPSAQILQNCNTADAILDLLGDKANQFQAYRDGNRKLINSLKPVVHVLHAVSGILGEAAAMVSLPNQYILSDPILTASFPGAIPTDKSNPCRC
jgi:fungal STAND N-terminal Goodbye domain